MTETGQVGDLYAPDAQVMNAYTGRWVRGGEAVEELAGDYTADTQFHPNRYVLGDSVAVIAGIVRSGTPPVDELNFQLGLVKDPAGGWRIATEHTSLLPPLAFTEPVTADQLIDAMDDAGIQRAVVLSVAYWFGDPTDHYPGDEHEHVRAENDWTAAEVAKYPDRLVAFCGVSPLRDYAVAEIRRCARERGMRGVKLHLANSKVNLHDAAHVRAVREVFSVANELGLALVVHTRTHRTFGDYGRREAEVILNELLPAAPDVPIQIAHLWGGGELAEDALAVFAEAVSSGDPRARNLLFDLTDAERNSGGAPETLATLAGRIRQIGVERVLYGSDMLTPDSPPPVIAWTRMRRKLPLTDQEFADIADNVAPYLR
jgi:predicted TIM-barrel fold metal-dependent hydrolase